MTLKKSPGMTLKKICKDMVQVLDEDFPSNATVCEWTAEFSQDRDSIEDDSHSGRPKPSTTDKQVGFIYRMVLDDRRLTV